LDIAIALPSGSWHAWAEILAMKFGAICPVALHGARRRRLPKAADEHTQSVAPAKTRFCDAVLRNGIVAQIVPLPYLTASFRLFRLTL
jgi:hypothetical protein